ncbi:MAG: UvrD-helicase domain-containing protein [Thermodesulfovibrionales bacterium]
MSKTILEQLNPQQRDAITHNGGPLLILAGAGSGKTRVITHKFAYLARKNSANSILTVTFTNKAAGEMRERISRLTKRDLRGAWIGTFHSQCTRILRNEIEVLGYRRDFSIYDEDDQSNLVRHILKEFKIYEALYKGILSRISALKSSFISPEDFLAKGDGFGFEEKLARVYVRYQDELKRCNALDFDDLIVLTIKMFEEHPEILEKYTSRFRQVLVDEFQDTSAAQYRLLRHLAAGHRQICVVGDDDQSIYAFRGANIENILNFEKDFPEAKVIKLEQNYRSTRNILDVSGSVIRNNPARREKTLFSERADGDQVMHCWFGTEEEEAKYITGLIKELYLKGLYDYKDFGILYRINLQSRSLEDALRHERLPYRVLGGVSFYQRKEIKDIVAYMRLALNRDDNVSLRRVINCPPRGIGASTLSKVEQFAKKKSVSLFSAIKSLIKAGGLTASAREKLDSFVSIIEKIASEKHKTAADMLRSVYRNSGYADFAGDERADNINELIASAEEEDISAFADRFSLYTGTDEENRDNAISLMTLHGAKGLEFPVVFISGVEEGILPYFKAATPREIAEERRLLYVGMTRAKDLLWLTGARRRKLYAKVKEQEPSRFLGEIPDGSCKRIDKIVKTVAHEMKTSRPARLPKPALAYAIGARVKHPKWGVGVVRDCYGEGEEQKITVNFPSIGVKRLALKFANLQRI